MECKTRGGSHQWFGRALVDISPNSVGCHLQYLLDDEPHPHDDIRPPSLLFLLCYRGCWLFLTTAMMWHFFLHCLFEMYNCRLKDRHCRRCHCWPTTPTHQNAAWTAGACCCAGRGLRTGERTIDVSQWLAATVIWYWHHSSAPEHLCPTIQHWLHLQAVSSAAYTTETGESVAIGWTGVAIWTGWLTASSK